MAYAESRARFGESLDVMRLAWTQGVSPLQGRLTRFGTWY